jgi:hypothetical protein
MRITEKALVLIATVITAVSALFCIISLATKGWGISPVLGSLFCAGCSKTPQALSIISFILLIASIITLVLVVVNILHGQLRFVPIAVLFTATFFLLSTFSAYFGTTLGYSYNLMVVAHFFAYVALAVAAYWLGHSDGLSGSTG